MKFRSALICGIFAAIFTLLSASHLALYLSPLLLLIALTLWLFCIVLVVRAAKP
jgi:hypothetical protein